MKVLFLGPAPGASWTDDSVPLGGRVGKRLGGLMGMRRLDFLHEFDTANILDEYPGRKGSGDAFPLDAAREAASKMDFSEHDLVVMLGRNVQRVLGFKGLDWFEEIEKNGVTFVAFPHPSGRNRWWNSVENCERAERYLKETIL